MIENKYPATVSHKNFHEQYKLKLQQIINTIPASGASIADIANLNHHIGVLVSHIKTDDKKIGIFLNK